MSRGFESVGRIVSRVTRFRATKRFSAQARHRSRPVKFCRCGHPKSAHERHPAIVDLGIPSGENCLSCDCPQYRFGGRRVA